MYKVIIIGGGFGGLNAAQALKRAHCDLLMVDRTNHHVFQPLLYQVATAALSVANIASPLREILRNQKNITVIMAQVEKIDPQNQLIEVAGGQTYAYDYLIIAPGASHSYFGRDQWESHAPGLKTVADAVRIREQLLLTFEKAERSENLDEAQTSLSFAVIGAGPTGVEMAGSIAEFAHHTLLNNFRRIKPERSKIYLIEGANQVLPSFPASLAKKAHDNLQNLGVDVLLNTFVTDITPKGIYIGEKFLPTSNVIWAAGNQASPLLKTLKTSLDKQGRVIVNSDLTVPGYSNVFVIGDAACCSNKQGKPLPGIAPVAIQQGRYVAKIIAKQIPVEKRKPFHYFDKGTIATIGRAKAVGMIGKFKFSGLLAWLVWCFVHILYLINFRHRILVTTQWIFLYFSSRRQGRVITRPLRMES